ncbi:ATP-binding protein [Marinospirillum perlucidum]|uniref:ATP-binding protein n=1 Tax=Marinospirillum perlucidum TaxID=1982602 RepID=UPI000DF1C4EE|nr:ATP-binding protein [Marinospirillum perlucidum]
MKLSLRNWILLGCFLPAWLLVILGGGWLLQNYFTNLEHQLTERGRVILGNLAPTLAIQLEDEERLALLRNLSERLLEAPDVRAFSVYDQDRTSLLHAGPSMHPLNQNPDLRWSLQPQVAREDESLRFIQPLYEFQGNRDIARLRSGEQPRLLGWAELEFTLTPGLLHQYRLFLISGVLLLVFFTVSLLLVQFITRSLTQRLRSAEATLKAISQGEVPGPLTQTNIRELQSFGENLEEMLTQVTQREDQLLQSIDEVREDASRSLDVIEAKNIELDMARKDALQASRIKSEFLANMSHEIRTPLHGIVCFSNLLTRTHLDVRQKEYLGHIWDASETMLGIISDILDFSKIEAGKMVLEEEPVNLRELLDACLAMQAPQAHRKDLNLLGVVYDDVPSLVKSDPLRLKQLFSNLISNALKFTNAGEVVVRIMLDDEDEGGGEPVSPSRCCIRIAVSDTGIGLSEEQRQKLFQAFSQADTSQTRQFGGTGLGLAICKQLVQQMGGQIDLDSEEGEGSTFWFTLPLEILEEAAEPLPWLMGRTIGVLEAHRLTNQAWCHQLRSWGARVVSWSHPAEMLSSPESGKLSALLLGMGSQHATATDWLDALDHWSRETPCPVLLLLNTSEPEIHAHLRHQVSDHLLLKPLSSPRLKEALEALLEDNHPVKLESQSVVLSRGEIREIPKILAVDDAPTNLLALVTLLQQLGYETLQAKDGKEAVARVQEENVSLVLMDIQMPGMNGVEATRQIRALGNEYRSLPIIALTAHAVSDEKQAWMQVGINDVLIKPLNEKLLIELLHSWLGDRGQAQPNLINTSVSEVSEEAWQACPVDRELGIHLAAGRAELADELLGLLLDSLEQSKEAVETALRNDNDEELIEAVHRLHGATRYCGVPDLAQITEALETQLKAGQEKLVATSLEQLFYEIERLLDWQERDYRNDWHSRPL